MKKLIADLTKIEHGFKHIIEAGDKILTDKKAKHFDIAMELLQDNSYQARMLATYILGQLSVDNPNAMKILETKISNEENWRVQEMLAKAFDHYCKTLGYEKSLSTIQKWLTDKNANVRRAVVEGLRIWTSRPYFKTNPTTAIEFISNHKADESQYLRKSVGNALRDISRKHPDLIAIEISTWYLTNSKIAYTRKILNK